MARQRYDARNAPCGVRHRAAVRLRGRLSHPVFATYFSADSYFSADRELEDWMVGATSDQVAPSQ